MRNIAISASVVLLGVTLAVAAEKSKYDPAKEKAEGFVSLFDGKSLSGWTPYTDAGDEVAESDATFGVQDGEIYCPDRGADDYLASKKEYGDFVLRLEYKLSQDANSGVFLRAPISEPGMKGFEVQIVDDTDKEPGTYTSGAILDVLAPKKNASKPVGEWNELEIQVRGLNVAVILNGEKVIDTDFAKLTKPMGKFDFPYAKMPAKGHIGLQSGGGEFWMRNIRIKTLGAGTASAPASAPAGK